MTMSTIICAYTTHTHTHTHIHTHTHTYTHTHTNTHTGKCGCFMAALQNVKALIGYKDILTVYHVTNDNHASLV